VTQPPIQPLPLVMTIQEVAEVLRCSEATIERYVHSHELAAIKIGRERRFRADDVLDFVASKPATTDRGGKARRGSA
jgi:excisionase family DNA binding protein